MLYRPFCLGAISGSLRRQSAFVRQMLKSSAT